MFFLNLRSFYINIFLNINIDKIFEKLKQSS